MSSIDNPDQTKNDHLTFDAIERYPFLENSNLTDELKSRLVEVHVGSIPDLLRHRTERGKWLHHTPIAIALTGLITMFGTFSVNYIMEGRKTEVIAQLEHIKAGINTSQLQLKNEIKKSQERAVENRATRQREREFQLKILEKELRENRAEVDRARSLLFLVRAGVLDRLNDDELRKIAVETLRKRGEASDNIGVPPLGRKTPKPIKRTSPDNQINQSTIELIVASEVTSQEIYEERHARPIWPRQRSGIEIGIGYDIGHSLKHIFIEDWQDHIPASSLERLKTAIGVTGESARKLVQEFEDITISWDAAIAVFTVSIMPRWANNLRRAVPSTQNLPPDCFGSLLSLTYNRGLAGYTSSSDRFKEMHEIKKLLEKGLHDQIPRQIRAMKRLWPASVGLQQRRENEALLFARCVDEMNSK